MLVVGLRMQESGPWRLGFSLTGGEGNRAMGPKNRRKQVKVSFEVKKGKERVL